VIPDDHGLEGAAKSKQPLRGPFPHEIQEGEMWRKGIFPHLHLARLQLVLHYIWTLGINSKNKTLEKFKKTKMLHIGSMSI